MANLAQPAAAFQATPPTLTLQADNNISISASSPITLLSAQTLTLSAGNTTTSGTITINSTIDGGTLNLTSGSTGNTTINSILGGFTALSGIT